MPGWRPTSKHTGCRGIKPHQRLDSWELVPIWLSLGRWARSSGRTSSVVGALRFQRREIVHGLAEINEFPFHSRANQSTIAVIIQADAMNRLQVVSGSIDYIEQFEGTAA